MQAVVRSPSVLMLPTVDGWNPAPVDINIPFFTGVFYIAGGAGFQPSTVVLTSEVLFCLPLLCLSPRSIHVSWFLTSTLPWFLLRLVEAKYLTRFGLDLRDLSRFSQEHIQEVVLPMHCVPGLQNIQVNMFMCIYIHNIFKVYIYIYIHIISNLW